MRLPPHQPDEMPEKQRALFDLMVEGRDVDDDGYIGGPFDAWLLNPSTGRRIWQLGGSIRHRPTIDRRYVELAILMTGQQWQAEFEFWAHTPMGREAGLPDDVIEAVRVGAEPAFSDDGDEICWRFCRKLLDREKVTDDLYQRTVDRFGTAGVADLVTACGFYTLVSMTLNTFEVPLPAGAESPFGAR